jgi:periplasmic protein TonB
MTDVPQLLESRGSRIGRWVVAALVVLGLHVGAVAIALMQPEVVEDFEGVTGDTVVVDMTLTPVPQPEMAENLAHAPVAQQEMRQTQEASKKVVEKLEKDVPPVDPSPAPEPEVVLPKAQLEEKEEPKEEAKDAVAEKPQQDRDQEAAAPPRQAVNIARVLASWQTQLTRQLNRQKRMPAAARLGRGRWVALVAFTVDRKGQVLASRLTQSTGIPALDEEALALLKRVVFPPAPDELPGETLEFTFPYNFHIN